MGAQDAFKAAEAQEAVNPAVGPMKEFMAAKFKPPSNAQLKKLFTKIADLHKRPKALMSAENEKIKGAPELLARIHELIPEIRLAKRDLKEAESEYKAAQEDGDEEEIEKTKKKFDGAKTDLAKLEGEFNAVQKANNKKHATYNGKRKIALKKMKADIRNGGSKNGVLVSISEKKDKARQGTKTPANFAQQFQKELQNGKRADGGLGGQKGLDKIQDDLWDGKMDYTAFNKKINAIDNAMLTAKSAIAVAKKG